MTGNTSGVTRAFLILAGLVIAVLTFAAGSAQAAGAVQTLGIVLRHNAAATERLPHYRAKTPISINVRRSARAPLRTVTVTALGPRGEAITAPLARTGKSFSGDLDLIAPGTWKIAFFGPARIGDGEPGKRPARRGR